MSTTFVQSKDGTAIAITQTGRGPHLILVDGAFCYRNFGPAKALAEQTHMVKAGMLGPALVEFFNS